MENMNFEKEKTPWHDAIMAERSLRATHSKYWKPTLENNLPMEKRKNCLVLGDASHIVTSSLVLDEGFEHATVVDGDPLVLDDFMMDSSDTRFTKIQSAFKDYSPAEQFDFIYGKSVAFIRKDEIVDFLKRIHESLTDEGVFVAVYAANGDSFRPIWYIKEGLENRYKEAGFTIKEIIENDNENPGLLNQGRVHNFVVVAGK
jgi:hypothetical protein